MSDLEIIQVPLLRDNYGYLLVDRHSRKTAMIDPSEAEPVLKLLKSHKLKLDFILNTHHHPDHTGGNEILKGETACEIICSSFEKSKIPFADKGVNEGDKINIGKTQLIVMELPGHTIGALAFYAPSEDAVFCGDTLFSLGCGRLFEGTAAEMWNSLRRLADLPRRTKIYCGHEYTEGNSRFALSLDPHNQALRYYCHRVANLRKEGLSTVPSTLETELEANPFLRAPLLINELGLAPETSPQEAFAEIRKRKDMFIV